jgi:hypothetical protein
MGIRHDIEQGLKKYEITKIDGQPTDEDLNLLTKELTNAVGSVASQNEGKEHGHVGMVIKEAEYITFSRAGTQFLIPMNPRPYPATADTDKLIRERQIAEHKADCIEYETYLGVENYLRRMSVKLINHEWLAEVKSETMGFNHLSPKALLTHLCNIGGSLDHMDMTDLISNTQKPWDGIKAPAAHFARGDKYEHQLLKLGRIRTLNCDLLFPCNVTIGRRIRICSPRMGREAQVGPDIRKLPHFHAERVRKASQAKQNHIQIGRVRHCKQHH